MPMAQVFPADPIRTLDLMELDRLARSVERSIEQRTRGRIRDLRVECFEDRVVLEGRARTYHAKQLAQEAALGLVEAGSSLINNIVVL